MMESPDIDQLFSRLQVELRRLASRALRKEGHRHTLQPTALVNEAYLRLSGKLAEPLKSRTHFVSLAARKMRDILVDHARRKRALKRGEGHIVTIELPDSFAAKSREVELLDLEDALGELRKESPLGEQIVVLRFFGDMAWKEIAEAVQKSDSTVYREWVTAQSWLMARLVG